MATGTDQADALLAGLSRDGAEWRSGLPYLVTMAQSGEHEAWEALYSRYRSLVYSVCLDRMRDHDRAEDHVSVTWEHAYTRIGQFNPESNFTAWLCRIAVNACMDTLRSFQARHIVRSRLIEVAEQAAGSLSAWGDYGQMTDIVGIQPDPAPGPEDEVLAAEMTVEARETFMRGLRALPVACKAIHLESRYLGISLATARRALAVDYIYGDYRVTQYDPSAGVKALMDTGMGRKTAKSQIFRARRAMRLAIEMTGGWGGAA